MLTIDYIKATLADLAEFPDADAQLLEGNGYDGVIDILQNMRSISYPCVILEAASSGTVQLVEGPLDTYTQSLWVMGQLGRGESEPALYLQMKALMRKVVARLLEDYRCGVPEVQDLDWTRFSYMQRWGGPNARGWEVVLTFKENFSLIYEA